MPRFVDLTGQKFGQWSVIKKGEPLLESGRPRNRWVCRCACGTERLVRSNSLRGGISISCGCSRMDDIAVHGHTRGATHGRGPTAEYTTWINLIGRCEDKKRKQYKDYGGRGIKVCKRWRKSFQAFIDDMGPRPSRFHSIDRINNDGNYEPSNCRWETRAQQGKNQRTNKWIEHGGRKMILADWSKETGIHQKTLSLRLKSGWPIDVALFTPSKKNTPRILELDGIKMSQAEWSRKTGIKQITICARLRKGWSVRKALTTAAGPQPKE